MSKAEERALERFPVHEGASKEWIEMHLKGVCAEYIEGYHQAEKDLALTWEDIRVIVKTYSKIEYDKNYKWVSFSEACKEVLNRFNKQKEDGKV